MCIPRNTMSNKTPECYLEEHFTKDCKNNPKE